MAHSSPDVRRRYREYYSNNGRQPIMSATVLVSVEHSVCTVTLNRPQRLNALNSTLLAELKAALRSANENPNIGAIVLTGAGTSFCSGDDLKEFNQQSQSTTHAQKFVNSIQDITRQIVLGRKFVVGAIRG